MAQIIQLSTTHTSADRLKPKKRQLPAIPAPYIMPLLRAATHGLKTWASAEENNIQMDSEIDDACNTMIRSKYKEVLICSTFEPKPI